MQIVEILNEKALLLAKLQNNGYNGSIYAIEHISIQPLYL